MVHTLTYKAFHKRISSNKEFTRLSKVASGIDMEHDAAKFKPLENNEDAFLLMSNINMSLYIEREGYCAIKISEWGNFWIKLDYSEFNFDKQKAVRYAIVKAAAYIGYLIKNK